MSFELSANVNVRKDAEGRICQLQHLEQPFTGTNTGGPETLAGGEPKTARKLAEEYLKAVVTHYQLPEVMMESLTSSPAKDLTDDTEQIRFAEEKSVMGNTTMDYAQTCFGIPVWGSGIAVRLEDLPLQVVGSRSTVRQNLSVKKPAGDAAYTPAKITEKVLVGLLGIGDGTNLTLNGMQPYIYRYDPDHRDLAAQEDETEEAHAFEGLPPTLSLPKVDDAIEAGKDYMVTEVLFTYELPDEGPINWSALVEAETGSVLYLRSLVGCCSCASATGLVYLVDPISKTGNTSHSPDANETTLNTFRDDVSLRGLKATDPGDDQKLTGEYIELKNVAPPAVNAPTSPTPGDFDFTVDTDDFSAVNAYHNCDRLFRLLEDLGFDVASYFDGTTFPVPVDHRGFSGNINARAPGNATRTGSGGFQFGLAASGTHVGIAGDWRVVLHEFGHALLWDHVRSPNFRFAHSAGDSLAAILNDPENQNERGLTFPWVNIGRRHDRTPAQRWAWYGPNYNPFSSGDWSGYKAEQILSSTMFRIYRAAGGDASDRGAQEFAAYYLVFLIIKAIGLLTPTNNAEDPEDYCDLLIQADSGSFTYNGANFPAGFLRKVLRWGFEQQGAFRAPGSTGNQMTPGEPPAVDLFIDDGRNGTYEYEDDQTSAPDIWVRHDADGGTDHQDPQVSEENHIYVRIRNRGTEEANRNVVVKVYTSSTGIDATWPMDWQAVSDSGISVDQVGAGEEAIVGPFSWTPDDAGRTILAEVSGGGDRSHAIRSTTAHPVPTSRLVPFDNNLAMRAV